MRSSNYTSRNGDKGTHRSHYHIGQNQLYSPIGETSHKQSTSNNFNQLFNNKESTKQTYARNISYKDHYEQHSIGEDVQISSWNEMRKKEKTLHQIPSKRKEYEDMLLKKVDAVPASKGARVSVTENAVHVRKNELDIKPSRTEKSLKHIVLVPDHHSLSGNESSGVELCKKLFGVTVFEYSNGNAQWNHISKDRKLVVQGVVEGSASYTSGKVHRGDMLIRINDVDVSWHNFTSLLNSLNRRKKVKLTFQSPRIVGPKTSYSVLEVPDNDLCFAVTGKRLNDIQSELSTQTCVALYLTLVKSSNDDDSDEKDDVIYAFPPEEQKLTALRGLFMTLSSALVDIVNQPASCSSLVLSGTFVNVAYKQIGSDVLVFAMPENRISSTALAASLDSFCSLMELLFSNVKSAFSDCDRNWLDRVLALMFYEALGLYPLLSAQKMALAVKNYNTVKMLNLSHENKLICDEILSEFEALDFDDYLDGKDLFSRRQYTVQGTCLYYKDHLLCSHIAPEQQRHINLFLNCHGLLTLSSHQHVDQVMVWQELKSCGAQEASLLPAGYRPSHTHSFLQIVGLNHYYLVAVIEAGGCSQPVQGQARPISLLVDQGKATLAQLEAEDVHMSQYCEERLVNTSKSVILASADKLYRMPSTRKMSSGWDTAGSGRVNDSLKQPSTPSKPFSGPFSRSKSADRLDDRSDAGSAVFMRRQGSKLSYGSNDSTGSGSSTGPSKSKGSRVSSIADLSGIVRSLSLLQIDTPHEVIREGRLDRGRETTLFSFLHLDAVEGILICPTEAEMMEVHSSLQQQIIDNFSRTCHKIKALFDRQIPKKNTSQCTLITSAEPENDYKEVGILFFCNMQPHLDKKRQATAQHYWVVGRCWSSPRYQEMYVCFHESASQSLVEMAFTLGFGS